MKLKHRVYELDKIRRTLPQKIQSFMFMAVAALVLQIAAADSLHVGLK